MVRNPLIKAQVAPANIPLIIDIIIPIKPKSLTNKPVKAHANPPTTNCPSPPILNRPPLNATRAAIAIPLINAILENVENK